MPVYKYTVVDSNGKRVNGIVDANTQSGAVNLLRSKGYYVINVEKSNAIDLNELFNIRGVSFSEIVSFTRQLATMISAGLPLSRALEVLSNQTPSKKFRKILTEVLHDVEGGSTLASAMARHPDQFSDTYRALVQAGESSGKLDIVLVRLAETMEAEHELRSKFKSAMIYPSIIMAAMVGVFILLMVVVIPKLADMYESLDIELPVTTQFLISISDFMVNHIYFVILGGVGFVLGLRFFFHSSQGKHFKSRLAFILPVFGNLNKKKELTEFTRTLSLLINSAVPIVDALNIVSTVMVSNKFKNASLEAAKHIEKGGTLSDYFQSNSVFPPILGSMAATGEETGQLDEVLLKLSEFYNKEADRAVEGLSAALEPVILIMLGAMVGFLIISIITPIYKITSAL